MKITRENRSELLLGLKFRHDDIQIFLTADKNDAILMTVSKCGIYQITKIYISCNATKHRATHMKYNEIKLDISQSG